MTTDRDELVERLNNGAMAPAFKGMTGTVDLMVEAAARIQAGMQWQPIETAPRDGTPFLAFLPQADWAACLKPTMTVMFWASWENFASLYAERIGETEGDAGDWLPTHWMPLPNPPALKGGDHGIAAMGEVDDRHLSSW